VRIGLSFQTASFDAEREKRLRGDERDE
jgi:hypothetical protein